MVKKQKITEVLCVTCGETGDWVDIKSFSQVTGEVGVPTVQVAVGKCLTCGVSQMVSREEL